MPGLAVGEVAATDDATFVAIQELLAQPAQGEAAVEEPRGAVRSEGAGDDGAFVVADEGEQYLAAGGIHLTAGRASLGISTRSNKELLVGCVGASFFDRFGSLSGVAVDDAYAPAAGGRAKPETPSTFVSRGFQAKQGRVRAVVAGFEHAFDRSGGHDGQAPLAFLGVVSLNAVNASAGRFQVGARHGGMSAGELYGDGAGVGATAVASVCQAEVGIAGGADSDPAVGRSPGHCTWITGVVGGAG
ncbi:hypothetical protein ACWCPX_39345 [Streptomyces olivaceoviridis]